MRKILMVFFILVGLIIFGVDISTVHAAEGDVWLEPTSKNIASGTETDIEVHMDTGGKNLGAFNIYFDFDPVNVEINSAIGDVETDGKRGMSKGANASSYTVMFNDTDVANGHFRFAGITTGNYANGSNVHIATIHIKTANSFNSGTTNLSLRINELSDELGHNFSNLNVSGGSTLTYAAVPGIFTVTPINTPSNNTTPTYVFGAVNLDGGTGTPTWGGACNGHFDTTTVSNGDNTFTATSAFSDGTYSDCTLTVNDGVVDTETIIVPPFTIDTISPTLTETTPIPTFTNDSTPDYVFSSNEAGTITYGGDCSSPTTEATVGSNTITFNSLNDGQHNNCTITVTDAANNVSSTLNVGSFTVDTSSPTLAEVTAVSTPTSDSTPDYTFSSTEAGTITYGGDCSSSTTEAVVGNNTITFNTLTNGTHNNCTITVTDSAGNVSGTLNVTSFEVVVPVLTEITPITTPSNNNTPTYVFHAANLDGGTGTPTWGGACNGHFDTTTVSNGDNTFTATSAFSDGTYSDCTLTVNDGVVDTNTLNIPSFIIDTTAPTSPVSAPDLQDSSDTGVSNSDNITSDSTPSLSVQCTEDNSVIRIYVDGNITGDGRDCLGNGANTVTLSALSDGNHDVTYTESDAAGNESGQSPVLQITIDTSVNAPVITSPTDGDHTTDSTPTFTGSGEDTNIVNVTDGNGHSCSATVTGGSWSCEISPALNGGNVNFQVTATDLAGNVSSTVNINLNIDIPVITEITPITTPSNNNTPTYVFHAANLDGGTGTPTWGGACNGHFDTTTVSNGDNTFTATSAFSDGTYSDCTLTVNDGVVDTNTLNIPSFIIDTSSPTLAEVTAVSTPTSDSTPDYTFSSTEAGTITYGGDCSSSTTEAVVGNNTITFNTLTNGTHNNCTITVTDSAGNVSSTLNVTSFEVNAPVCTSFTYSSWSECQPSGVRTRNVISSSPSGCNGGSPVVSESCVYENHSSNEGTHSKKTSDPEVKLPGKSGEKMEKNKKNNVKRKKFKVRGRNPELAGGKVEVSFKGKGGFSKKTAIDSKGKWSVKGKVKKKSGTYKVKIVFYDEYGNKIQSKKYKVVVDTVDPEFTDLPKRIIKRNGEKVYWKARDNRKMKRFKAYIGGRIYKIKIKGVKKKAEVTGSIVLPKLSRGSHRMKIKAYDRAGNKTVKYTTVVIR